MATPLRSFGFGGRLNRAAVGRYAAKALRSVRERLYERRFSTSQCPAFRGVFPDFASASLSAPETKPLGFDTPDYANEFRERLDQVFSFDYPMMFWLKCLLAPESSVFDFGGHAGTHFYAYARYLEYPAGMKWTVCDLPAMLAAGRKLADEKNASGITFTSDFTRAEGADILIAAGSLQYIESPGIGTLLKGLKNKPRHLLLNKLPLSPGEQFVTLQNGRVSFHPQYVFNRGSFIRDLLDAGYLLVDQWSVETHPGRIPFHPEKSFPCHSGLYFKLNG